MDIVLSQDFFPKIGGAHLWLYEVYKRWKSPVTVLTQNYSRDSDCLQKQIQFDLLNHGILKIQRHDLLIENINIFSPSCIKKYRLLLKHIKKIGKNKQITLHCIRSFPEGIGAIVFQKIYSRSCRVVIYAHGEELRVARTSRQLGFFAKWVYSKSDNVIANSEFTKNLVKDICPHSNIEIIHPGVDTEAFKISEEHRRIYRRQWGWADHVVILTTIARLEERKNHAMVIRAIAALRHEGLHLAYVVGGEGSEKNRLIAMVEKLGLEKWVRFTGYLNNEDRILSFASADIHVMPSIKFGPMIEGFGIVFLEAAAAGIPSISGNVGGQPEAVLNNKTGLVVDGSNLAKLKNKIKFLTENESIRKRLGEQGQKWAALHDWHLVMEKTYNVINQTH